MKKITICLLALLSILTMLALSGCAKSASGPEKPEEPEEHSYTVRYEITGPEGIAEKIRYDSSADNSIGYEQITIFDGQLPWETTTNIKLKYASNVQCTVDLGSSNSNTYTLNLYVNNELRDTDTGEYYILAIYSIIP
jgi:hypothetical protein